MTDKLKRLMGLCKCSVSVQYNKHRDYYETAKQFFDSLQLGVEYDTDDIVGCTLQDMIDADTIIELRYYPNTPIGFTNYYGLDLDLLLDAALKDFDN